MYNIVDVYDNVKKFNFSDRFAEFSRVEIDVSDDKYEPAGNKTGRTLTGYSPWATKQVAEDVLEQVKGFVYQPYTANSVALDPAVELGDAIFVRDIYSGIYTMETRFGKKFVADISAPSEEEIDHEFPYEAKSQRKTKRISRRVSETESRLDVQAGEISAKVSSTSGEKGDSFSWKLTEDAWRIYANGDLMLRVNKDGLWVNGDGKFTGDVYAGNIQKGGAGGGYIGTGVLSSGINRDLGYANLAGRMFDGYTSVGNIITGRLKVTGTVELLGYKWGIKTANVGGETIYYLGIIEEA